MLFTWHIVLYSLFLNILIIVNTLKPHYIVPLYSISAHLF